MNGSYHKLGEILEKVQCDQNLDREEIVFLLGLTQENEIKAVFEAARKLRFRHFKDRIFLYGFIHISNFCRNRCEFCYYRSANALPVRYRLEVADIIEVAQRLAESGVHLIDLTMGEDPQ